MSVEPTAGKVGRLFFGHPVGLAYLSFTEVWERFSFYGMQALLLLYMVDQALTPGHAGDILGLAGFRAGLESVFGPLSTQALASQIFGLYTGLVYFTPLFGGLLADRLLGQRRTVILGGVLMAAGHLLMAFESAFLIALVFLIVGCGCLKGNISAQVGRLYARDDDRSSHAFSVFNVGINIGAFVAPLVCGALGEIYGWSWGFGAAAVGMLIGLATYVAGFRHLPPDPPRVRLPKSKGPALRAGDGRVVAALIVMIMIGIPFGVAYGQEFNVFTLWARETLDRDILGWTMPVTWFQALDGGFVVAFTPLILRIWQNQAARGREPSDMGKMAIGAFLGVFGMAMLACASLISEPGALASPVWGIACFAIFGAAFIYQWPPTLALVARASPPGIIATMMGVAFFSTFIGNYAVGWIGGYYEKMPPESFWAMHGAISLGGALLTWALLKPLNRIFLPQPETLLTDLEAAEALAESA